MRNKFKGNCFICGKEVGIGEGFFQSVNRLTRGVLEYVTGGNKKIKFVVRCKKCVGEGNIPNDYRP